MNCPQCGYLNADFAQTCSQCNSPLAADSGTPAQAPPPVPTMDMAPQSGEITKEQRTWGMLAHLSAIAGFFLPFGNIIGPLVVWLIKKDEMMFVNDQGKEALNFQISVSIYAIVSAFSIFLIIGFLLLPAVMIFSLVMTIIACVKANEGEYYRYPLCIRFIA